jgi:hypothetical protein
MKSALLNLGLGEMHPAPMFRRAKIADLRKLERLLAKTIAQCSGAGYQTARL